MQWNIDVDSPDTAYEAMLAEQLALTVNRTDISTEDRRAAIAAAAFLRAACLGVPIGSKLVAAAAGDLTDDNGYGTVTITLTRAVDGEILPGARSKVLDEEKGGGGTAGLTEASAEFEEELEEVPERRRKR